jgi:uncharacterized membrane protein
MTFIVLIWAFMLIPMIPLIGTGPFWGILPFFLITLFLLYALMKKNYKDGSLVEELSIWSDLIVVRRTEPNNSIKHWEANPYWSTIHLYDDEGPVEKYLTLKGNGREIELGSFLSPDERKSLHRELKKFI